MKHQVHNLIILDESGSMERIKRATIESFNEIIQTTKALEKKFPEQEHRISFVTFNGVRRKTHLWNRSIKSITGIDEKSYKPDASTPLYDAIGFAASKLAAELTGSGPYNTLVTIFTDGEENTSQEWSGAQIKQLIAKLKLNRWTFTYIGTNHDVVSSAAKISITNTVSFEHNAMFSLPEEISARERYSQRIRDKKDTSEDFYKQ